MLSNFSLEACIYVVSGLEEPETTDEPIGMKNYSGIMDWVVVRLVCRWVFWCGINWNKVGIN